MAARLTLAGVIAATCVLAAQQAPGQQQPTFRGGVELIRIDAQVTGRDSAPLVGLGASDFNVSVAGSSRRVVSAQFIDYRTQASLPPLPTTAPLEMKLSRGRVFILAVDESSFAPAAMQRAIEEARRFVDHLAPNDVVGLYKYPFGIENLDLTHTRGEIGGALGTLRGRLSGPMGFYRISPSEVIDITAGDTVVLQRVVDRECEPGGVDPLCPRMIRNQAASDAGCFEQQASQSLSALLELLRGLAWVPGRKTVVLVSGGLISADRTGARPDVSAMLSLVSKDVAISNTSLYALQLDNSFADIYSASARATPTYARTTGASRGAGDRFISQGRDGDAFAAGLERLVGQAGGSFLRVRGVSSDFAFDQVLKETTAYYLLGVESLQGDRDGKMHPIKVRTTVPGASVQHRMQLVIPKGSGPHP